MAEREEPDDGGAIEDGSIEYLPPFEIMLKSLISDLSVQVENRDIEITAYNQRKEEDIDELGF